MRDSPTLEQERVDMAKYLYCKALSGITWLAMVLHPDLAFVSTYLRKFSANPGKHHWSTFIHV